MNKFVDRLNRRENKLPKEPSDPMVFVWGTVAIGAFCAAVTAASLGV